MLVYFIHNICSEKTVSCKGFVILTLKAINMARSCHHYSGEGSFFPKVVPGQPHKILFAVAEILGRGNHMEFLVQDLASFFLGEFILFHESSTWNFIAHCWDFIGPADYGGLSSGDKTIGA